MKPLRVIDPAKLTFEELTSLRDAGYDVTDELSRRMMDRALVHMWNLPVMVGPWMIWPERRVAA